ncbi:MAG: helix-turn-helix domain-containing protein, partial [Clostridiales bacterium]|nr:helix-turn-helix domain-containing protein [Clostridiales bacterium]
MKLCEKLYELRRAAGLSQEELAERLNVSRQAVSKWENGAAQPELSKLVELSRLYGVSVDELLSLEEAEKGDAKAASSVEASTPAPAQETLAAPKKVRRQKLLLGAAAVCLALAVGLALYNNHRVKQLERQVSSLQSQIMSVQSNLSSQIAGISSSVREAMEESATLTAQFDYTVKRFDLDTYTCTVAFALRPKTVQEDLAVSLRLRSLASDDGTAAVELVRDEYDVYRGEAVLSMNDNGFEATAAYDIGGERRLETIRDLPGFADEALPKLYEDLSFGYGFSRFYSDSIR